MDKTFLFFNSNFFIALITLLVGSFAIYLYIKQKRDYKRDAANIILMEIRYAEKTINDMKINGVVISLNMESLLPSNSWFKYNHLFIKNFDRDELDLVNNFYNQCSTIDSALMQLSVSKQIEQKSGFIQQGLIQIAKDAISEADYDNKKKNFLKIIEKEPYVFPPGAPIKTIKKGLSNLATITTTTVGSKLKRIAKIAN